MGRESGVWRAWANMETGPYSELRRLSELYKGEAACHLVSVDMRGGEGGTADPMDLGRFENKQQLD